MSLELRFLGGANEVGASGTVLSGSGRRFLVDYGIGPSDPPRFPIQAPEVDLAMVTHSHVDHIGMIPWLCGTYNTRVLATPPTIELADVLLRDSLKISAAEGFPSPYDSQDVKITKGNFKEVKYHTEINQGDWDIRLHPAGHIPGSTMYQYEGTHNVLFTGDINTIDTHLLWKGLPSKCEILIVESTYAGNEHQPREQIEKEFLQRVRETVDGGGQVIVPAFAVARTQELLMLLSGQGHEVWVDGMGRTINKIFTHHPDYLRSVDKLRKAMDNTRPVRSSSERQKVSERAQVIVTTSGMLGGGPALFYMKKMKDDPKSAVLMTGYQGEGTNGRMLLERKKLEFYGKVQDVQCKAFQFDFSAHAGHSQLKEFIYGCEPEHIVLIHGDNREKLADDLDTDAKIHLPLNGEKIEF